MVLGNDVTSPVAINVFEQNGATAVSYTHLDVYKRQDYWHNKGWDGKKRPWK